MMKMLDSSALHRHAALALALDRAEKDAEVEAASVIDVCEAADEMYDIKLRRAIASLQDDGWIDDERAAYMDAEHHARIRARADFPAPDPGADDGGNDEIDAEFEQGASVDDCAPDFYHPSYFLPLDARAECGWCFDDGFEMADRVLQKSRGLASVQQSHLRALGVSAGPAAPSSPTRR